MPTSIKLKVKLNRSVARASALDAARKDLPRRAAKVQREARRLAPKRTGDLRRSIDVLLYETSAGPVARIGSDSKVARWQHEGTGIYGPTGRPIRPVRARVLRFKPKGARKFVYAAQVRGVKPTRFLVRALPAGR